MGIINILHKCEYSHRNFFNVSRFNVNPGSADVTHTLVFFSRLSLSESILMSVFALSSDNQGDSLTFWSGGVDTLTWERRNYVG